MARLKLFLLGPFLATLDESPLAGLRSGKSRALLAFLAGEAGRPHQRSALATLLWGEHPDEAARLSLRVALSSLRDALAPYHPDQGHPPLLEISHQTVQLNLDPEQCWVDTVEFDARLAACETHPHQAISRCSSCIQRLTEATALYRGDFVADLTPPDSPEFEEWRLLCQERYHRQATLALEQIAQHYLCLNNHAETQRYARQLLALEPWRETAHRQLMRALALDGQRTAALAQYDVCQRILAEELGAAPEPETTALWERIRDGLLEHHRVSNLLVQLTPFIGRKVELAQIADWLSDPTCRLLTLVGPGGIGKTRLALAAAAQQNGAFPDGVYFVPVSNCAPEACELAIAEALQFTFAGRGENHRAQLLHYLRSKQLLLVLDDLRPLPANATWVVELLQRVPDIKVMITAQQRLNVHGESLLRVQGLDYPASMLSSCEAEVPWETCCSAIDLFVQCARRVQPDFVLTSADFPHVAHICHLVEGMPLAIELAAAWIPTLSCAEIAQEIENDPGFLVVTLRDIPERHRSLQAVFDQGWELLSPEEQLALSRLSVFRGSFDRSGANMVAGASLPVLAALTDKALLRREKCPASGRSSEATTRSRLQPAADKSGEGGTCYSLHELVRQYAARRLAERPGELAATESRHGSYFLAFLKQQRLALVGAGQPAALAQIAQQSENVRTAWIWAADHGRWNEIEDALPGLFLFCYMHSWFQEGKTAFGRLVDALNAQTSARPATLYGQALASQGWFAFLSGQMEQAQTLFDRSLTLLRTVNAPQALAFVLAYRGAMALHRGDITEARATCTESLALYREAEDHYGMTVAHNILGRAALQIGDYDEARRQCQWNRELAHELGNHWSEAFALELLGRIAMAQWDGQAAKQFFTDGLKIRREINDRRGIGLILNLLGDVHLAWGMDDDAERCYRDALGVFQALGYQAGCENARAGLDKILSNATRNAS